MWRVFGFWTVCCTNKKNQVVILGSQFVLSIFHFSLFGKAFCRQKKKKNNCENWWTVQIIFSCCPTWWHVVTNHNMYSYNYTSRNRQFNKRDPLNIFSLPYHLFFLVESNVQCDPCSVSRYFSSFLTLHQSFVSFQYYFISFPISHHFTFGKETIEYTHKERAPSGIKHQHIIS